MENTLISCQSASRTTTASSEIERNYRAAPAVRPMAWWAKSFSFTQNASLLHVHGTRKTVVGKSHRSQFLDQSGVLLILMDPDEVTVTPPQHCSDGRAGSGRRQKDSASNSALE